MRRREFVISLIVASFACLVSAGAQQKAMPVIGFLSGGSPGPFASFVAAFQDGLSETGYIEGQNVAIEYRWAEGRYDRLSALATDLVGRKVDVIFAAGDEPALAAKSATSALPIVFLIGSDPVGAGLVASFARPGGNLTGVSAMFAELVPKRFELLSELVPQVRAIALLVNPNNFQTEGVIREMQDAARARGVLLRILKASSEDEIDAAFATLVELQAGGLIVDTGNRPHIAALASRHAVRAIALTWGTSSDSSSNRLGTSSANMALMPVRFPPGRAKLATRPALTGSLPMRKTIGIAEVALFATSAGSSPAARITSTLRPTRSVANADSRS